MKPSILYEICLTIFVVLFGRATCFNAVQESKYVTYNHKKITCSRNMPCQYVICLWERNPTINPDRCTILDNHCSCPENKICAMTDHVTPGSAILSFQYRCKDPANLFDARIIERRQSNDKRSGTK